MSFPESIFFVKMKKAIKAFSKIALIAKKYNNYGNETRYDHGIAT